MPHSTACLAPALGLLPMPDDAVTTDPRILGTDDGTDPFVVAVRATCMPMIITDLHAEDNPIIFANDAFCRLTGYGHDEVLGRNCRFLQGPDTDAEAVRAIHDAVADRRSICVDITNYKKSGERFWNRLSMAPVPARDGAPRYFSASQLDVTLERERVELERDRQALAAALDRSTRSGRLSQARMSAAADAGELGIWELDLQTREMVTSRWCKLNFGRDPDKDFPYAELLAAVHPDDRGRMQAAVARTVETGEDYRIVYRILRPDSQLAWVRIHARVERDEFGRPTHLAGISQDVTEPMLARRRAELLLALDSVFNTVEDPGEIAFRAAELLGRTLDVSRAGYGTIDTAAETITIERDWNAAGIRSLAGTLHFRDYGSYIEDLKRGETVIFADARLDARTRETADALIAISAQSVVNMPVTESGGLVALLYLNHATARPWTDDEMLLVREVAQRVRQAVERRRAEHALRQLAASLERQVEERSAELLKAENALRQSQKMETVGQLTGGLAHDLNNFLAAISGSLEVIKRKTQTDDGIARFVAMGQNATKRAAALTHRLLAFSRQQTLEPKLVNANRLIAAFEELVRRTIGPQIELEVIAGVGLWTVSADPIQLESSVLNLCVNARDAMPGGGRLVIETANRSVNESSARTLDMQPGQYVSICVSDNGTGMPPDVVARAFDPFFTTKPIGAGTGLGLSMVYGFARQSGGHVRIYSEVGQGTMVCVYLPRRLEQAHDIDVEKEMAPTTPGSGETVLVVDDEESVRFLMTEELRQLGYDVREAGDGPSAIDIVREDGRIDLLVTDVGLPGGLNGRQVAEISRALVPALKVLFVTGYAENAALSHGHLLPGMHVLTKPFEMAAFAQRVQSMLKSGSQFA